MAIGWSIVKLAIRLSRHESCRLQTLKDVDFKMLRNTGMDEKDAAYYLYEFMKECPVVPVEQFVKWMMRQQASS